MLQEAIQKALIELSKLYPEFNIEDEHNKDTARRISNVWMEMCKGYNPPDFDFTTFKNKYPSQPIVLKDIPFSSFCFHNKTIVRTVDGAKFINTIKEGDIVVTFNESGEIENRKVKAIMERKARVLINIKTKNGNHLKCTPEHPIYVIGRGWINAGELELGDKLVTLRNGRGYSLSKTHEKIEINYGKSLGYFLGALCSDGGIWRNKVTLRVTEKWFAEKFISSIKDAFNLEAILKEAPYNSGFKGKDPDRVLYEAQVISGALINIIDEFFGGKRKKGTDFKIPAVVFNSIECFYGFFEGYIDGDGSDYQHPTKNIVKYNRIYSSNTGFIEELENIFSTKSRPNGDGSSNVRVIAVPLFLNGRNIRFLYEEKFKKKFNDTLKNKEQVTIDIWRQIDYITSIVAEEAKGNKPFSVYNLEVDENPTYIANNIWVHNCSHHFLPFSGKVHIGYLPGDKICGLSKLPRVVEYFASKPQVQEELGNEIVTYLGDNLDPILVIVLIEAEHTCVACRGVKSVGGKMITKAMDADYKLSIEDLKIGEQKLMELLKDGL